MSLFLRHLGADLFLEDFRRHRIEAGGGLVEDEDVRIEEKGEAGTDFLAGSTGERARGFVGDLVDFKGLHQVLVGPGEGAAADFAHHVDDLADAQVIGKPADLRHVADVPAQHGIA